MAVLSSMQPCSSTIIISFLVIVSMSQLHASPVVLRKDTSNDLSSLLAQHLIPVWHGRQPSSKTERLSSDNHFVSRMSSGQHNSNEDDFTSQDNKNSPSIVLSPSSPFSKARDDVYRRALKLKALLGIGNDDDDGYLRNSQTDTARTVILGDDQQQEPEDGSSNSSQGSSYRTDGMPENKLNTKRVASKRALSLFAHWRGGAAPTSLGRVSSIHSRGMKSPGTSLRWG